MLLDQGNIIHPDKSADFINRVIEGCENLRTHFDQATLQRGEKLLQTHQRVR